MESGKFILFPSENSQTAAVIKTLDENLRSRGLSSFVVKLSFREDEKWFTAISRQHGDKIGFDETTIGSLPKTLNFSVIPCANTPNGLPDLAALRKHTESFRTNPVAPKGAPSLAPTDCKIG